MSPDSDIPIADNVESLIQYAVRAPSSHNTQPWCFRVSGNCVFLYADRTRALLVNDPEDQILVGMMLVLPAGVQAARQLPVVHVAIVADGSPERVAALRTIFLEEMRAVNRGELDN